MSNEIKVFRNSRNEAASTDGRWWWSGTDADAATVALAELQPASALFPFVEGQGAVPPSTVAKARAAFIAALRKTAPTVTPDNDAERAVLRKAWDDATEFAASRQILATGKPVFDCNLMVVGTADAVVKDADRGNSYTYCYFPDGAMWRGEMNVLVHILYAGLPIDCADDAYGRYTLRELSRTVMALVMRCETDWYRERVKDMPF